MRISIEALEFDTIVGILDFERVTPQKVIVNLFIEYDYKGEFINYADVSKFVKEHMIKSKFLLLEDALASLSKNLKINFPLLSSLDLTITKPSILPDCKVSVGNIYHF